MTIGAAVPIAAMWPLSQAWYGDRLSADYRPKPVDEHQNMLSAAGLTSDFWQLQ